MSFEKQFKKITNELTNAVSSIEGSYDLSEIITDDFISLNTSFSTYEEFISEAPLKIKDELSDQELELLDEFVNSNTNFSDWEELYQSAGHGFALNQLKKQGFDFR